ncbi:MAG: hypothetical protein MdMp014T_1369 [Treponematales bacterium]
MVTKESVRACETGKRKETKAAGLAPFAAGFAWLWAAAALSLCLTALPALPAQSAGDAAGTDVAPAVPAEAPAQAAEGGEAPAQPAATGAAPAAVPAQSAEAGEAPAAAGESTDAEQMDAAPAAAGVAPAAAPEQTAEADEIVAEPPAQTAEAGEAAAPEEANKKLSFGARIKNFFTGMFTGIKNFFTGKSKKQDAGNAARAGGGSAERQAALAALRGEAPAQPDASLAKRRAASRNAAKATREAALATLPAAVPAEAAAPAATSEPPAQTAAAPVQTAEAPAQAPAATSEPPAQTAAPAQTGVAPAQAASSAASEPPAQTTVVPAQAAAPAATSGSPAAPAAEGGETAAQTAEAPAEGEAAGEGAEDAEAPAPEGKKRSGFITGIKNFFTGIGQKIAQKKEAKAAKAAADAPAEAAKKEAQAAAKAQAKAAKAAADAVKKEAKAAAKAEAKAAKAAEKEAKAAEKEAKARADALADAAVEAAGGAPPVEGEEGTTKKAGMPVILSVCVSDPRTQEDEDVLDAVDKMVIETGNYDVVKTNVTLGAFDTPTAANFSSEDLEGNVHYVLAGGRTPGNNGSTAYSVSVYNLKTGDLMASDQFSYNTLDEVSINGSMVLARIFYLVPVPKTLEEPESTGWKSNILSLTPTGGGVFRYYKGGTTSSLEPSWMSGIGLEYQFYSPARNLWLAAELQVNSTMETAQYWYSSGSIAQEDMRTIGFRKYTLEFPLLFKVNWYPSHFMVSANAGVYGFMPVPPTEEAVATMPLFSLIGGSTTGLPIGYTAGLEGGVKMGPGILSLFLKYSSDIWDSFFLYNSGETSEPYKRMTAAIGLAYKAGVLKRPEKQLSEFSGGW